MPVSCVSDDIDKEDKNLVKALIPSENQGRSIASSSNTSDIIVKDLIVNESFKMT